MQIVLLSGGSGKRLWPLSNDIRSKQFLKLLSDESGRPESMVQRVFRQISSQIPDTGVTIATSRTQVSSIINQLDEKVSVCVEPCRRDTFPAIVLSAAFLKDQKGVDDDEVIAVCPVDPYVDDEYFQSIGRLPEIVEKTGCLTLMGIEPTYPSEKYGYIIPEDENQVSRVKEFKEKPDRQTAGRYIQQGALWNAGVFAFKLGWLMSRAHELIDFTDYNDLLDKYDTLEKISFDYAVTEKESNIRVLRYAGEWKDVGTWNTLTEVMNDNISGNAVMDDTCENTHVINELSIPVICMGIKDAVVAVSNDGVLVSDKIRSGYMKPYVEKVETDVHYAEKSWGSYTVIDVQPHALVVRAKLVAGHGMSYHYHELRDEVWTILSGEGQVTLDGETSQVMSGDVIKIPSGVRHRIYADTDMVLIEVQNGKEISIGDKIKCSE